MNRLGNLARVVVFLLSTLISAGIFGGFAVWAVSTLDPATQEVIGLVSSPPWLSTAGHPKLTRTEAGGVGDRGGASRPAAPSVSRRP
jgi:hypothetical protein